MKRFDMEIQPQRYYMGEGESYVVSPYESTNGDWVKWYDVQELKQSLTELLDVARSLVETDEDDYYKDYRMVAREARKVIAKFEGTNQ